MSEAQKTPVSQAVDTWRPNWWTYGFVGVLLIALGVALGAGGMGMVMGSRDDKAQPVATAPLTYPEPPKWWRNMQGLQRADYWSVYDCAPRGSYPTPCPDLTATIEFKGDDESTPPVLINAVNAKGEGEGFIILKRDRTPETCVEGVCTPAGWVVTVTFGYKMQPFAYNERLEGRWSGPRMFVPSSAYTFSSASTPRTIEIYAGDATAYELGNPIPADRLGKN